MAYTGNEASIAFGTSSFDLDITSFDHSGMGGREALDASLLSTTDWKVKVMTKLNDSGEIEISGFFDPDQSDPKTALTTDSETITITFPIRNPANATNATWAFSGAMSDFNPGNHSNDELVSYTATIQALGEITITAETT